MAMEHAELAPASVPIPKRQSYMVGGDNLSADRRWPGDEPCWRMSSKEGVTWEDDGPINEAGRQILLQHFGLSTIAAHLPLEKLATMSPATLERKRRTLERHGAPHLELVSDRPGAHVPASLAA